MSASLSPELSERRRALAEATRGLPEHTSYDGRAFAPSAVRPPSRAPRPIDLALPRERVSGPALAAWRLAAVIAVVAPFVLGWSAPPGADADWVRLMRGMALTKLALALPIVVAADWRVQRAGACAVRVAWVVTAVVAAWCPGWIWGLRATGPAAALFHVALAAAVGLLVLDATRVGRGVGRHAGRGA